MIAAAEDRAVLKHAAEVAAMRAAGRIAAQVLDRLCAAAAAVAGMTPVELNELAERWIAAAGGQAAFRGVVSRQSRTPYPAAICVSVNEIAVHGIPDERPLAVGDVVSIDCGVRLDGICVDAARSLVVGSAEEPGARLVNAAAAALAAGVAAMQPWVQWSVVAAAIEAQVQRDGFRLARDFFGHGVGRALHEPPRLACRQSEALASDFVLMPGMTLAVETVVTTGCGSLCYVDELRWAARTRDGAPAAHAEETVAVLGDRVEVLTASSRPRRAAARASEVEQ